MIAIQTEFRPALPNVYGAADYREFREVLLQMDTALRAGLGEDLVQRWLEKWESAREGVVAPGRLVLMWRYAHYALRCNVARHLMGLPFREFSVRLADSELLQWFCSINTFGQRKAISKSSLERFDKWFDVRDVERVIREQLASLQRPDMAQALAGRDAGVRLDEIFADSTCVRANIHYPVDWVLLRDATRSLIAAIVTIRRQGLKHRMPTPGEFVTRINRLCIQMTHSRRRKDGRKYRKKVLREMKQLSKLVQRHGERYRDLLEARWQETDWTEKQTQVVIKRIDNVLEKLPKAIEQAHERIIGERRVKNTDKVLSLYEDDVHVLVRGKADAEVEFGNGLYLAEQRDGLIVDWELFRDHPPADSRLVKKSLKRIEASYGSVATYCGDRGFDTKANTTYLESENVFNGICPKAPAVMAERTGDLRFMELQRRRGQTEARIGIFKNAYLGRPLRSKGFEHKRNTVAWCVLTHNLWVLARTKIASEQQRMAA
ncbi:MAG: hypothetical protein QGH42_09075 [Kiritimatiellia bacterium]|nr:hypothetical protein [Kiritimatiellia bacterium]MDP6811334.1 hypothetical protein [Kiritimatiellia bacterium]MDP7024375.1 hypothetical protein [Kiritimatiellia bacterium]